MADEVGRLWFSVVDEVGRLWFSVVDEVVLDISVGPDVCAGLLRMRKSGVIFAGVSAVVAIWLHCC